MTICPVLRALARILSLENACLSLPCTPPEFVVLEEAFCPDPNLS
jgi:hypothetical protein